MILLTENKYLPIPGAALVSLALDNPGLLARTTMMTRLSSGRFDMLTSGRTHELGTPLYWTVRDDGRGEVWPVPDRDYTVRARGMDGHDPDKAGRAVQVQPVEALAAAVARAAEEAQRARAPQDRVEYFGNRPTQEEGL